MRPPLKRRTGRHRFTVGEYLRMHRAGVFGDDRVELLNGEIYTVPPQFDLHGSGVIRAYHALTAAFGPGYWIRLQLSARISNRSMPEPDLTVAPGDESRPKGDGPVKRRDLLLVVEVSHKTLRRDRGRKARTYAAAGIADYWIVNLRDRVLEVYREPRSDNPDGKARRYRSKLVLVPGDSVSPLARPGQTIPVADMFPLV